MREENIYSSSYFPTLSHCRDFERVEHGGDKSQQKFLGSSRKRGCRGPMYLYCCDWYNYGYTKQAVGRIGLYMNANKNRVQVFWTKRGHLYSTWQASKISGLVYISRHQYLIYLKWFQQMPEKGTECYWQVLRSYGSQSYPMKQNGIVHTSI